MEEYLQENGETTSADEEQDRITFNFTLGIETPDKKPTPKPLSSGTADHRPNEPNGAAHPQSILQSELAHPRDSDSSDYSSKLKARRKAGKKKGKRGSAYRNGKKKVIDEDIENAALNDGQYRCYMLGCEMICPTKNSFKKHILSHGDNPTEYFDGEPQYICPVDGCGKRFLDNSKLKRH